MADVQLQYGYSPFANKLLEAILRARFRHREQSIIFAVGRLTYGYSVSEAPMTNYQLAKLTGLSKQHVGTTVGSLHARNVLTVNELLTVNRGQVVRVIGIQKDFDQWDVEWKVNKPLTVDGKQTVDRSSETNGQQIVDCDSQQNVDRDGKQIGTTTVNESGHTLNIDKINKSNKTNSSRKTLDLTGLPDGIPETVAREFIEHRRLKKAPLTQLALDRAMRAAVEASRQLGITPEQVIHETIDAGWQAIKTDWLKNRLGDRHEESQQSGVRSGGRDSRSTTRRVAETLDQIAREAHEREVGGGDLQEAPGPVRSQVDVGH